MYFKKFNWGNAFKYFLLISLFPLFFILHGYNDFFELITLRDAGELFIFYELVTVCIFLICIIFFKEIEKAFIFSFFSLCFFFFFGLIYDSLKRFIGDHFISSYTFLLPFIFIILLSFFILLKKNRIKISRMSVYINWLLIIFVIIEVVLAGYNIMTGKNFKNILLRTDSVSLLVKKNNCFREKPDIFFIVLDEYTSSKGLTQYFNFDNRRIDSLLVSNGFYISWGSRSNYNMTPFSLSSTFNFDYLNLNKRDSVFSYNVFLKGIETFKKNKLTPFLADQGYEIFNYGCFDIEKVEMQTTPFFKNLNKNVIANQTLFSRIQNNIGWKFRTKNIFNDRTRIPRSYLKDKSEHIYRNNLNAENLLKALSLQSNKPRFVYAHLMLPHDPFYFDSTGSLVSDTLILKGKLNREDAYLSQLKYCNKILEKIIEVSSNNSRRERVVVIEGDHGFGYHDNPTLREREFSNLNTYYFSDRNYQSLYPTISPVNTFRIILNKYFCSNFPLLNDSSFFMKQKTRF